MMEELYKVMDDLLDVEFQMKSGIDLLKELEEFYLSNPETEASEARKLAVLIKGYLQSMKSNIREIIRYIDDTTLEKSNEEKKDEQEAESTMSEKVQELFAAEFRKEYKDKDHCPCLKACRYHGNCKECVAIHRAHQEHVPNCMRPLINKKLKLMSELTEHTLANEIEVPHEILRK